jgi:hypothetical protein
VTGAHLVGGDERLVRYCEAERLQQTCTIPSKSLCELVHTRTRVNHAIAASAGPSF